MTHSFLFLWLRCQGTPVQGNSIFGVLFSSDKRARIRARCFSKLHRVATRRKLGLDNRYTTLTAKSIWGVEKEK